MLINNSYQSIKDYKFINKKYNFPFFNFKLKKNNILLKNTYNLFNNERKKNHIISRNSFQNIENINNNQINNSNNHIFSSSVEERRNIISNLFNNHSNSHKKENLYYVTKFSLPKINSIERSNSYLISNNQKNENFIFEKNNSDNKLFNSFQKNKKNVLKCIDDENSLKYFHSLFQMYRRKIKDENKIKKIKKINCNYLEKNNDKKNEFIFNNTIQINKIIKNKKKNNSEKIINNISIINKQNKIQIFIKKQNNLLINELKKKKHIFNKIIKNNNFFDIKKFKSKENKNFKDEGTQTNK